VRERVNDTREKRSALVITSLALALLAGLGLAFFKGLAVLDHADEEKLVGIFLAILLTPIGIIIGVIALFRSRPQFGFMGLAGLLSNVLFLAISVFMFLKALVEEWLKWISAVR
jgi:hypothetical protein